MSSGISGRTKPRPARSQAQGSTSIHRVPIEIIQPDGASPGNVAQQNSAMRSQAYFAFFLGLNFWIKMPPIRIMIAPHQTGA